MPLSAKCLHLLDDLGLTFVDHLLPGTPLLAIADLPFV
jgi:hypothetical protein